MSAGSTYSASRAGGIGFQSAVFLFWGIQLEFGNVMTPLEKPEYRVDLANCQRFYTMLPSVLISSGAAVTAGQAFWLDMTLPVTMRAVPSIAFANVAYSNSSSLGVNLATASHLRFSVIMTATGAGWGGFDIQASAEL
jgi:hypothetical protein